MMESLMDDKTASATKADIARLEQIREPQDADEALSGRVDALESRMLGVEKRLNLPPQA